MHYVQPTDSCISPLVSVNALRARFSVCWNLGIDFQIAAAFFFPCLRRLDRRLTWVVGSHLDGSNLLGTNKKGGWGSTTERALPSLECAYTERRGVSLVTATVCLLLGGSEPSRFLQIAGGYRADGEDEY